MVEKLKSLSGNRKPNGGPLGGMFAAKQKS